MERKKRIIVVMIIVIIVSVLAWMFYFAYLKEEIRCQKCLKHKKEIDRMIEEWVNEISIVCPGC